MLFRSLPSKKLIVYEELLLKIHSGLLSEIELQRDAQLKNKHRKVDVKRLRKMDNYLWELRCMEMQLALIASDDVITAYTQVREVFDDKRSGNDVGKTVCTLIQAMRKDLELTLSTPEKLSGVLFTAR